MKSKIILAVAVVSTTLLVGLVGLIFWGAWQDNDQPPSIVYSIDPNCHPQTSYSTGPANTDSGLAWYHTCVQNHGPFYLWQDDKLVQRGQYKNGQRDGVFTSYAADGSVIKETRYVDGKIVP